MAIPWRIVPIGIWRGVGFILATYVAWSCAAALLYQDFELFLFQLISPLLLLFMVVLRLDNLMLSPLFYMIALVFLATFLLSVRREYLRGSIGFIAGLKTNAQAIFVAAVIAEGVSWSAMRIESSLRDIEILDRQPAWISLLYTHLERRPSAHATGWRGACRYYWSYKSMTFIKDESACELSAPVSSDVQQQT